MRRFGITAAIALTVLLSGVATGAPPAYLFAPEVLALPASGAATVSTLQRTSVGHTYLVTVSGVYTFDGFFGLSDCGHKDPASAASWHAEPNVTLDGQIARCFEQPFTPAHSYQWSEPGTGAAFTFKILKRPDDDDDLGYLVVTVAEA